MQGEHSEGEGDMSVARIPCKKRGAGRESLAGEEGKEQHGRPS